MTSISNRKRPSGYFTDWLDYGVGPGRLWMNVKTAKGLGLIIPPSLLLRADQVVE